MKDKFTVSTVAALLCVFVLLGCGGGGGGGGGGGSGGSGDSGSGNPPPPASSGSISGAVSGSSTPALTGVQVNLSGAGTSVAVTDANGRYSFANLGAGTYAVTPAMNGLTFTPRSISVAVNGQGTSGANFVSVFASTQMITDYMAIRHSQLQPSFASAETSLGKRLNAQGLFHSGTHYIQSGQSFVALVQSFATDSIAFVRLKAQTLPVERAAAEALLANYSAQDASFADTYYRGVTWGLAGTGLDTFIGGIQKQTSDAYALAALQLP